MKKRATFFVIEGRLYTRQDGKPVEVWKWLRSYKGERVTPVFPYVLGNRLVLVASNRPIGVFNVYANGDVKEEPVPDEKEYSYKLVLRTRPVHKKKGPP